MQVDPTFIEQIKGGLVEQCTIGDDDAEFGTRLFDLVSNNFVNPIGLDYWNSEGDCRVGNSRWSENSFASNRRIHAG
jgi:hypothetical protein